MGTLSYDEETIYFYSPVVLCWFMEFRPVSTLFRQLPLKIVFSIPFLIQVIGIVSLISYLSFQNGQVMTQDLSSQLRNELADRIGHQIQSTLDEPMLINQMNVNALEHQDIQLISGQGEHLLWQQAKIFPSTNLIYCATEADGAFLGVGLAPDESTLHIQVANADTNRYLDYYEVDKRGRRSRLRYRGDQPYDPRDRPWYIKTKAQGTSSWSEIYLDFDTHLPTITASTPAYDPITSEFIGVCATDLILSKKLNEFLQSLDISPSGMAFVMEPSNLLIASSIDTPVLSEHADKRLPAIESKHPLIRSVAHHLIETYDGLDAVESTQLDFRLDGKRQYIQVVRFDEPLGLDWIVVLVVPERDFMARIHKNTAVTLVLSVIALLFTLAIGLIITHSLSQPLLKLSAMAQNIARREWDQTIEIDRSDAIDDLCRSFMAMAEQLRSSLTTLEQRIDERTNELVEANRELAKMAYTDGLTQTANRRYFDSFLKKEWKRLIREQGDLALILCDVDHFKDYNDTYGHQQGDRCLQHIAQVLMDATQRPADLVARYGGEEFAIVLPNTNAEGATHLAQRIQAMLQIVPLMPEGSVLTSITISMGIGVTCPNNNHTLESFIAATDHALYTAKANGRNRYFVVSDLDEE